jgi:hypothetical protein
MTDLIVIFEVLIILTDDMQTIIPLSLILIR